MPQPINVVSQYSRSDYNTDTANYTQDTGALYGAPYSAAKFTAVSTNYGEISLKWSKPTGVWVRLVVVRNTHGFPEDPDDGEIIHDSAKGLPMRGPDTNLAEGSEVYYAIFVRTSEGLWYRSAVTIGLSVKNFGTHQQMLDMLPAAVKTVSRYAVDTGDDNKDLSDFLRLVAFEYDRIKTQAYLIKGAIDPASSPAAFIKPLVHQLNLTNEPALGYQRTRSLAANSILINQRKGSWDGLKRFIKAFTGFNLQAQTGKNLFLDYNASSFEETPVDDFPGLWSFTNATGVASDDVLPFEIENPTGFPNRRVGVLTLTPTSGTVTMTCGGDGVPSMIPLPVAEDDYTLSIYAQSSSGTTDGSLTIDWYNRFGTYLSSSTAAISFGSGTWTRVSVSDTAPAGASFAVPVVELTSYTGDQYFDAAQFENAASATDFEDARRLNITLLPTRVNELPNPNFTVNTNYWTATNAFDFDITSEGAGHSHLGAQGPAAEIYPDSLGEVTAYADPVNITAGEYYSFSIYSTIATYNTAATDTTDEMYVRIAWLDSAGDPLLDENEDPIVSDSVLASFVRKENETWTSENPVLGIGHIGVDVQQVVDSDYNSKYLSWKIGDGVTPWNDLEYASYDYTYIRKTAAEWAAASATVLGYGDIAITLDDGTFKIGDGVQTWGDLGYTTSLPAWLRMSVTAMAPTEVTGVHPDAAKAVVLAAWVLPSDGLTGWLIDEALFEKSPVINTFFDGSSGLADTTSVFWEGTADESRSFFYRNKRIADNRLQAVLPDYVPTGSTFAIYYSTV